MYRIEKKLSGYYDQAHIVGIKNGKILWLKKIINETILVIEIAAHYIQDNYVYYNRDLGESWQYKEGRCVWDKRFFNNFETVNFMGASFNVPSPVGGFLTFIYGNWAVPEVWKDWRRGWHNICEGYWK